MLVDFLGRPQNLVGSHMSALRARFATLQGLDPTGHALLATYMETILRAPMTIPEAHRLWAPLVEAASYEALDEDDDDESVGNVGFNYTSAGVTLGGGKPSPEAIRISLQKTIHVGLGQGKPPSLAEALKRMQRKHALEASDEDQEDSDAPDPKRRRGTAHKAPRKTVPAKQPRKHFGGKGVGKAPRKSLRALAEQLESASESESASASESEEDDDDVVMVDTRPAEAKRPSNDELVRFILGRVHRTSAREYAASQVPKAYLASLPRASLVELGMCNCQKRKSDQSRIGHHLRSKNEAVKKMCARGKAQGLRYDKVTRVYYL